MLHFETVGFITYNGTTQYIYSNNYSNESEYLYCETTVYEDDSGMKFTVGVDPYAGQSQKNPVSETYSPYNMSLLIPARDI